MRTTRYQINAPQRQKAAVVADLHGVPTETLYQALRAERPDMILIPGDLTTVGEHIAHRIDPERQKKRLQLQKGALDFLDTAVTIAPTYYSRGNHEWADSENEYFQKVRSTGTVLLENRWTEHNGIFIGGQNSAGYNSNCCANGECCRQKAPDIEWMQRDIPKGYKILLCHHPEYYKLVEPYADLVLCGHTHGGQWRFFRQGVFAPNQGLFPKYSKGQYGKMIVSAGLTNTTWVPRIGNSCELVLIETKS